jgi:hypothetical protein
MEKLNDPTVCQAKEIPTETKRLEELISQTASLISEVQSRIAPILADSAEGELRENAARGESPLGNWLKDRNRSLESINVLLECFLRRIRL